MFGIMDVRLFTSFIKILEFATLVVMSTDCTVSCKSNYHTITTTTGPCVNDISIKKSKKVRVPTSPFC